MNSNSSPLKRKGKSQKGFSLIELLLSVALIGLLTAMALPVYRTLQIRNDLDIGASTCVQSMRRAQLLAQSSDGDTSWGVDVSSSVITVFKGLSYAGRDSNYDETFDLPSTITPTGVTSIVYAKFTGTPNTTGTLTLTASNGDSFAIVINSQGFASY